MRFFGKRRAIGISLLCVLVMTAALVRVSTQYASRLRQNLGPTAISRLSDALEREISVARIDTDTPGLLRLEGVQVARGRALADGVLATARRLEVRYDPALLSWTSLLARAVGRDTRAQVRVEGVRLPQVAGYGAGDFVSVEEALTEIDFRPALQGQPIAAIEKIALVRGSGVRVALVRDRNARWNYEQFREQANLPRTGKPSPFRGEVVADNLTVEVDDYVSRRLSAPVRHRATGYARVYFAGHPQLRFESEGTLHGAHGGRYAVSGHTHTRSGRYFLSAKAGTGDLRYWFRYLAKPEVEVEVLRGSADLTASLWRDGRGQKPRYAARGTVRQAAVRLPMLGQPVEAFQGSVIVDPSVLSLDGDARVDGAPVRISGDIVLGEKSQSRLELASEAVTLARVRRLMPRLKLPEALALDAPARVSMALAAFEGLWSARGVIGVGSGRFQEFRVRGLRGNFTATGDRDGLLSLEGRAVATRAERGALRGRNVRLDLQLRDDMLQVAGALDALGGRIEAEGWSKIREDAGRFYASGTARGIKLASLPVELAGREQIAGTGGARFVVAGSADQPEITGSLDFHSVALRNYAARRIAARVRYAGEGLEILDGVAETEFGNIAITGSVDQQRHLDLQASVAGLELARLPLGAEDAQLTGRAHGEARITGTVAEPRVRGRLQVYHPTYLEHQADYLESRFTLDGPHALRLEQVRLQRVPGTITADTLRIWREAREEAPWQIEGELQVQDYTLPRLLRLAGVSMEQLQQHPIAGELAPIRVSLDGPVRAPAVAISAEARRVAFDGVDLGTVAGRAQFGLAERRLVLERLTATSPQLRAEVRGEAFLGEMQPGGPTGPTRVDLRVSLGNADLVPFLRRFGRLPSSYVDVEARLGQLEATIQGPIDALTAQAEIALDAVAFNGERLSIAPFTLAATPRSVLLRGLRIGVGGGVISAPFAAVSLSRSAGDVAWLDRIATHVSVSGLQVRDLRRLTERSPYLWPAEASDKQAPERVRELLAFWSPEATGEIHANFSLPATLDAAFHPTTLSDAETYFQRGSAGQTLAVEVRLDNGRWNGQDGVATEAVLKMQVRPDLVDVSDLRLARAGGALVSAHGQYRPARRMEDATFDFSLKLNQFRLQSLARLPISGLPDRLRALQPLAGEAQLQATITGSGAAPRAQFSIAIEQPMVAGLPFERFAMREGVYDGEADQLRFAAAELVSRSAGSAGVRLLGSGFIPLAWPEITVSPTAERRLTLDLPHQPLAALTELADQAEQRAGSQSTRSSEESEPAGLVAARWLRHIAATEGMLEGRVTLGGTMRQPRNSGFLTLTGGRFQFEQLQTNIRDLEARVEFDGGDVRLARLEGRSSSEGRFSGGGRITLRADRGGMMTPSLLDLHLDLDRFRVVEPDAARLLGAGFRGSRLQTTLTSVHPTASERREPLRLRGQWPAPTLSGAVLLGGDTRLELAYEDTGIRRPRQITSDMRLDVRLLTGPNVWLRNPNVRLKLDGELHASNALSEPVVNGNIRVSRGNLTVTSLRLRNADGVIRVNYDGRLASLGLNPPPPLYIDVTAGAILRVPRLVTGDTEYYDATFEIRGTPGIGGPAGIRPGSSGGGLEVGGEGGLVLTVRTDPPLPSRDIEALIRQQFGVEGFGGDGANVLEALRGQIEQTFALNVTSGITSRIEDVVRTALGLSSVSLDVGFQQPLRLRLARRLFGPVHGSVTQEFGGIENQRRFEIYYRINPRLRVGVREDEPDGRRVFFFSGTAAF